MAVNIRKVIFALALVLVFCQVFILAVIAAGYGSWVAVPVGSSQDLYCLWGSSPDDLFAAGKSGTILRYDGSAWKSIRSRTDNDIHSLWGEDSEAVFAVGKSGVILFFDGESWSEMSSNTSSDLYGIWGKSKEEVYAVGSTGTVLFYDGSAWGPLNSGVTTDLFQIWGKDSDELFIVGKAGVVLQFDGAVFTPMTSGTTADLSCIWGTDRKHVYAAGKAGTVLFFDGSSWDYLTDSLNSDLTGIWGASAGDVFFVGDSGTIVHYSGSSFSSMNRNTLSDLSSVQGFSADNVFAAGSGGTILHYNPPAVSSISPAQADQGENLVISIAGRNLENAAEVRFGTGVAVNTFNAVSPELIKVDITVVPGAAAGTRNVTVVSPGGSFTLADGLTINRVLPTLSSISPDQDRQNATLNVTISGTDLSGANDIRLGAGISVNSFTVLSSTQITANITISSDAATGTRDVSVTTAVGTVTLPAGFTVRQVLPTISSITPLQGNQESSLVITIDGTGLTGVSDIRLGPGITPGILTGLSPNQMTAHIRIASGAATGLRDLSLTTPGGSVTLPAGFEVIQALPAITSISPNSASQGSTQKVTIIGTNLNGATRLRLGNGVAINSFTVLDPRRIEASITVIAGTETGPRDVFVSTPGGTFTISNSFTVKQGIPVISSISPENGNQGEISTVIISGSNLGGASAVSFGSGVTVKDFTNLSPTQIRVNILIDDLAATGSRDVSVTTPGGSSTLGSRFSIKEKPMSIVFIGLIWFGIAVIIGLFVVSINFLRKKSALKLRGI